MAEYGENPLTGDELKKRIIAQIGDLFMDWLYYGRKEDWDVPVGAIEKAVKDGTITRQEIVNQFIVQIDKNL